MRATDIMPDLVNVKATRVSAPPTWALLERKLISLMEKGAHMMGRKYAERSGAWYWSDDLDDYYERSYNWCLLYNMGGDESLVDMALKHWNATDATVRRPRQQPGKQHGLLPRRHAQPVEAQHPQRVLQYRPSR